MQSQVMCLTNWSSKQTYFKLKTGTYRFLNKSKEEYIYLATLTYQLWSESTTSEKEHESARETILDCPTK